MIIDDIGVHVGMVVLATYAALILYEIRKIGKILLNLEYDNELYKAIKTAKMEAYQSGRK